MNDRVRQNLGNYQLLQLIGQGGYAEVYLAQHKYLKKKVAVKVLSGRLTNHDVKDFLREAQIVAAFNHPHILSVFDFGMANTYTPFLVMQYAARGTLRNRYNTGVRVPLTTVTSYVNYMADALQYAHDARVIHRDVKPENMLLDERDNLLLSDFGIASVIYSSMSVDTTDNTGTPHYMAPEQFRGKPVVASDQYALAIVAYEWLCGVRPFHGNNHALAYQHRDAIPSPLRHYNPLIPSELEAVIFRALAKDPRQRFARIQDFAQAFEQAARAPTNYAAPRVAVPIVKAVVKQTPTISAPLSPSFTSQRSPSVGTTLLIGEGHTDVIHAVAWSPDGMRIASVSVDKTMKVWNVRNSENPLLFSIKMPNEVQAVAWSPDGNRLASADRGRLVQVWDTQRGALLQTYTCRSDQVDAVAWSPDGMQVASVSDGAVQIWDIQVGGYPRLILKSEQYIAFAVAWSPDGKRIAAGCNNHTIHVWNTQKEARPVLTLMGPPNRTSLHDSLHNYVQAISWSPDGAQLASASSDGMVYIWDAFRGGMPLLTYNGHYENVNSVVWSPDGRRIASSGLSLSKSSMVHVWDPQKGGSPLTGRFGSSHVVWSPDGTRLASASQKSVEVWQI
jgi:eukaryotic-like serine/threonine-protein kinase